MGGVMEVYMYKYLLVLLLTLGMAETAQSACTTQVVYLPDGSSMLCLTCCYGPTCTVQCY